MVPYNYKWEKTMLKITEIIKSSIFLNKLYPNGIEKLSIHKIDFMTSSYGNSLVYIYTNQKPLIDIPKYGVFYQDYNTIVIELLCRISEIEIYNSSNNKSYLPIEIHCNENSGYTLKQVWKDWLIKFNIDSKFIFQRVTAYFNNEN